MIQSLGNIISNATTLAGGRRDWAASEVSYWANLAAQEIHGRVVHTTAEALAISSTTSGENRITLPTDFEAPISLSNLSTDGVTGGRGLRIVSADWLDSQTTVENGEPEAYALYSTWMELWPSPDSAYSLQLRYYAKPPTLVLSTDTPRFDERWHPGWLYKTAELLELSRGNPENAALLRNVYISYMDSQRDDRAQRQMAREGVGLRFKYRED